MKSSEDAYERYLPPDAVNINMVPRRAYAVPDDGNPLSCGKPADNLVADEVSSVLALMHRRKLMLPSFLLVPTSICYRSAMRRHWSLRGCLPTRLLIKLSRVPESAPTRAKTGNDV